MHHAEQDAPAVRTPTQLNIRNVKGVLIERKMKLIVFFVLLWTAVAAKSAPPEVKVFAVETNVESNILLTCLATGFSSQDIIMWIKRDGRKLYEEDGLQSSGALPNGDGTFERGDSVEILRQDEFKYTCEVIHEASRVNVTMRLENSGLGLGGQIIVGVITGILAVALVVLWFFCCCRPIYVCKPKGSQGSLNSDSTLGSSYPRDINFLANDNSNGVPLTITGENISDRATNGTNCSPDVNLLLQNGNEHR